MTKKQLSTSSPPRSYDTRIRLTGLSWMLIMAIFYVVALVFFMLKQISRRISDDMATVASAQADRQMADFIIVFGAALVVLLGIILYFQIQNRREQLLEQSKDEFVSLVSHQLRAPLTSIRLFVEMLQSGQAGKLTDKQREYVSTIEVSTSRMIELVSDFLGIASLELGQLRLNIKQAHLEDIVLNEIEQARPLADRRQQIIKFDKQVQSTTVSIDVSLYSQIIGNLLSNAINYSQKNSQINVALNKLANGYMLDVTDTGIGIPKSAQAKVFQRFYRAENAKRMTSDGSGLGLYLVKKIVDMTGGSIWFDSIEGRGTSFHLLIPVHGMSPKRKVFRLK